MSNANDNQTSSTPSNEQIRAEFAEWSGGFKPSDETEVTLYMEVASPFPSTQDDAVRAALIAWMDEE